MPKLEPGFALVVLAVTIASSNAHLRAQDRSYGRSVVSSQYGIVATSEMQAS